METLRSLFNERVLTCVTFTSGRRVLLGVKVADEHSGRRPPPPNKTQQKYDVVDGDPDGNQSVLHRVSLTFDPSMRLTDRRVMRGRRERIKTQRRQERMS